MTSHRAPAVTHGRARATDTKTRHCGQGDGLACGGGLNAGQLRATSADVHPDEPPPERAAKITGLTGQIAELSATSP
ncbi:MAG: hypothetical protein ACRDN0_00110 [Trebonia sp.]